jgi:DNA-binding transcriptional LysR family regulator
MLIAMLAGSIELKHLSTFLAIAEERSFGRAADRLGYTQSAVSQQIAALEKAVGLPVFLRPGGPRPVELTDAGRVLHDHATTILAQVRDADHELQGFRQGVRGRLRIASFQSVSVKVLPPVTRTLSKELPDVDIDLVEINDPAQIVASIRRRDVDAAFLIAGHIEHEFRERVLFTDPYVAIAATGTFPNGPVTSASLADHDLIGQPIDDLCGLRVDAGLRQAGLQPSYVFRSADNAAVQAMARAGRGVALMPRLAVDQHDPGISVHDAGAVVTPRTIVVIWREGPAVAPAVGRFIELATDVTRSIAESDAVRDRGPLASGVAARS